MSNLKSISFSTLKDCADKTIYIPLEDGLHQCRVVGYRRKSNTYGHDDFVTLNVAGKGNVEYEYSSFRDGGVFRVSANNRSTALYASVEDFHRGMAIPKEDIDLVKVIKESGYHLSSAPKTVDYGSRTYEDYFVTMYYWNGTGVSTDQNSSIGWDFKLDASGSYIELPTPYYCAKDAKRTYYKTCEGCKAEHQLRVFSF